MKTELSYLKAVQIQRMELLNFSLFFSFETELLVKRRLSLEEFWTFFKNVFLAKNNTWIFSNLNLVGFCVSSNCGIILFRFVQFEKSNGVGFY